MYVHTGSSRQFHHLQSIFNSPIVRMHFHWFLDSPSVLVPKRSAQWFPVAECYLQTNSQLKHSVQHTARYRDVTLTRSGSTLIFQVCHSNGNNASRMNAQSTDIVNVKLHQVNILCIVFRQSKYRHESICSEDDLMRKMWTLRLNEFCTSTIVTVPIDP